MKRWRDRMPLREVSSVRRLRVQPINNHQGRTGEPSPASFYQAIYQAIIAFCEQGRGKAEGSFTERMRQSLRKWCQEHGPVVTFTYHLYRRRFITVSGEYPVINHWPTRGAGGKGFYVTLHVLSIDGRKPLHRHRQLSFALNRIIAQTPELLALQAATSGYTNDNRGELPMAERDVTDEERELMSLLRSAIGPIDLPTGDRTNTTHTSSF